MDEDIKAQALDSTLRSPSEALLSIQLLDFKTSLLEAIEELRIRRETEKSYEDQISKIVVEKQELEWQKETLQHQMDRLHKQNKEAMAAFKKQLQARMFAMEEEKAKYQLAVEAKEKETDGLKEALKELQISKYTLQKKLNETDQKLQMHLTAKEEHHKKLNEVERCYATVACQFALIKGVHGKLEHSVQEAMQLNKKLTSVNERQETEISNLKEELKKVTTDLIRSKVTSQYGVGEENINLMAKEKQLQELQQKIKMETAVHKKVQEENAQIKEEKREILSTLHCVQELLQQTTQMNVRMERELNALKEEQQTLERDNELLREKAKENEEKFLNLQNEHEKALRTLKKDEENLRREIAAIKTELNSLKGVHRHLEYRPSRGHQRSEQVEILQTGQKQPNNSGIQATKKENECLQSTVRKDADFGHKEEMEVKTTMDCSLRVEESQAEQNVQVLENSLKDAVNVERKQREASPRNTLCTDTDLITQGQVSEVPVVECKEAENQDVTYRMCWDENNANSEYKRQDNAEPLATCHTQSRKMLLDSADSVGACKQNENQEPNCSKQELGNATCESICCQADKELNTVPHTRSVPTPEAAKSKSEAVLCAEKAALCEASTKDKELSCSICVEERSQTDCKNCSFLSSACDMGSGLHKPEKNPLNLTGVHGLPFNQTHTDAEDRSHNDSTKPITRNGTLRSAAVLAPSVPDPLTIACGGAGGDGAAKGHGDNVSLSGTFKLCPTTTQRGGNVDDPWQKQPEPDSTEHTGDATNTCPSSAGAAATQRVSTDKLIPCKRINDDIQIHSIKQGHSLEINNSANNTVLKEKQDSLQSPVPGRKFAEGHLKESCSLPMRTSGNLVNISGRSSFELSTSEKKTEKTPVYLYFSDLSSCSRVNQTRGQAPWTPASKECSLLKEELQRLVENTKVISKPQGQNLSENVDRKETGRGSTSCNRAADTLNTSSIHQDPQGDPSEGWNATAEAFYDSSFPTEHVKEEVTALEHEQKSSPMTVIPARSQTELRDGDSSSIHKSVIQNPTEETEKILSLERLHSARKRKYEEGQ